MKSNSLGSVESQPGVIEVNPASDENTSLDEEERLRMKRSVDEERRFIGFETCFLLT